MLTSKVLREKYVDDMIIKSLFRVDKLPEKEIPLNVEAADIGYGYVKVTQGVDEDGNIRFKSFPSIVPRAPMSDMSGSFFVERDTIKINSAGTEYEVGPDCADIASKKDVRALHGNFINTEQYKVLFLAALHYIGKEEIDCLVLGLPVSNMSMEQDAIKFAKGKHTVGGKDILVKDVLVVPQPLGLLYNHALSSGEFERYMNTNTVVIDPGFHTFDFLTTNGLRINANRSGAREGGMHSVLKEIADSLRRANIDFDDLNAIDKHLDLASYGPKNSQRSLLVYGEEIELVEHIKNTAPVISENINHLINVVQDTKDISQILLGGGPSPVFQKGIKKGFPNNKIIVSNDGIFANAKGFLLWGMLKMYASAIKGL